MVWCLPVLLEPTAALWLEEVTVFVVSALMDISVGTIWAPLQRGPSSGGSVLRHYLGCGDAVPSQQLCNITPTADGPSDVKFEALRATDNRDSLESDTVVFSECDDWCEQRCAAMLPSALSWDRAAWPVLTRGPAIPWIVFSSS